MDAYAFASLGKNEFVCAADALKNEYSGGQPVGAVEHGGGGGGCLPLAMAFRSARTFAASLSFLIAAIDLSEHFGSVTLAPWLSTSVSVGKATSEGWPPLAR